MDGSVTVARDVLKKLREDDQSVTDWHVIESTAGRARQMNAGARKATGDVLLFLHADTWLPNGVDIMSILSVTAKTLVLCNSLP